MKFTKGDIKRMCEWLDGWALYWRPLHGAWMDLERERAWRDAVLAATPEHRRAAILRNLENFHALERERAEKYLVSACHFQVTRVYGNATDEMVARFELLAADAQRDAAKLDVMRAKIEALGLPAEVLSHRILNLEPLEVPRGCAT